MAIWIQIILWLITNIPEVIQTVKALMELIKKLPRNEQKAATQELGIALKAHKLEKDGRTKKPKHNRGRPTFAHLESLRERLEHRIGIR